MKISRVWAMPSRYTFTIKPIQDLLTRYVGDGKGWIDPFSCNSCLAEYTNDLNPATNAIYHMHALDFVKMLKGEFEGCLFDPPYSLTQVKKCYENIGLNDFMQNDCRHFPYDIKKEIASKIKTNGIVISFGWNSNGFGKKLGFEMQELLLVAHGRMHNDTIVVVEKKI